MIRVNVNALMDDFEQAAGSCEVNAKFEDQRDHDCAVFLMGAAAALRMFPACQKPSDFGLTIATEFKLANGVLDDENDG